MRTTAAVTFAVLFSGGLLAIRLPGQATATTIATPSTGSSYEPIDLRAFRPARPATRTVRAAKPVAARVSRPAQQRPAHLTNVAVAHPAPVHIVQAAAAAPPAEDPTFGCGPALAWLSAHSAPGFHFECPGYALGHQAMTCQNVQGVCPNTRLIVIADPCAAAYKNEAYNSWVVEGLASGPYDPYGYCHN